MQTVEGIVRGRTVWLDNISLEEYEGKHVIVLLPNLNNGTQDAHDRETKRLRYFAEKELGRELSTRSVEEIDQSIREMRDGERF